MSTTPLSGDTASGRSWPSTWRRALYPHSRLALWHAFRQHTRGPRPSPVRPNHRPALSRFRDPKPIPWSPGTTGGPGTTLSDIRRIYLLGKGTSKLGGPIKKMMRVVILRPTPKKSRCDSLVNSEEITTLHFSSGTEISIPAFFQTPLLLNCGNE